MTQVQPGVSTFDGPDGVNRVRWALDHDLGCLPRMNNRDPTWSHLYMLLLHQEKDDVLLARYLDSTLQGADKAQDTINDIVLDGSNYHHPVTMRKVLDLGRAVMDDNNFSRLVAEAGRKCIERMSNRAHVERLRGGQSPGAWTVLTMLMDEYDLAGHTRIRQKLNNGGTLAHVVAATLMWEMETQIVMDMADEAVTIDNITWLGRELFQRLHAMGEPLDMPNRRNLTPLDIVVQSNDVTKRCGKGMKQMAHVLLDYPQVQWRTGLAKPGLHRAARAAIQNHPRVKAERLMAHIHGQRNDLRGPRRIL